MDLVQIEFKGGFDHLRKGGELVLHLRKKPNLKFLQFYPFPDHLTDNVRFKGAALTVNQCTLAMCLLGPMTRWLLAGELRVQYMHRFVRIDFW
jgi:hypothetical protein